MSDQAIKLFEALSGVDEELLERCNQKANRKSTAVYRMFGKYGRAVAACVCLIVAGAAAWSGYRFVTTPYGSDVSGLNNSPAELPEMTQSVLTADGGGNGGDGEAGMEDKMAGSDMGAAGGTAGGGNGSGAETDEIRAEEASSTAAVGAAASEKEPAQDMQGQLPADNTETMLSPENSDSHTNGGIGEGDNIEEEMEEMLEKENAIADSRVMVSWEDAIALEPFAGYIPASLPAGYEPLCARRSSFPDSWNNMIYKWSDGEQILWLNMTAGEVVTREDIERRDGLHEYLAGEFRKELIPEPVDGRICFTLYYEDGMRIDYGGHITADEMWELVEAVSK